MHSVPTFHPPDPTLPHADADPTAVTPPIPHTSARIPGFTSASSFSVIARLVRHPGRSRGPPPPPPTHEAQSRGSTPRLRLALEMKTRLGLGMPPSLPGKAVPGVPPRHRHAPSPGRPCSGLPLTLTPASEARTEADGSARAGCRESAPPTPSDAQPGMRGGRFGGKHGAGWTMSVRLWSQ